MLQSSLQEPTGTTFQWFLPNLRLALGLLFLLLHCYLKAVRDQCKSRNGAALRSHELCQTSQSQKVSCFTEGLLKFEIPSL